MKRKKLIAILLSALMLMALLAGAIMLTRKMIYKR